MKNSFYTLFVFYCILFSSLSLNAQVFVKWDATGANNGTSWADAYTDLQMALDSAFEEIWVAAGTYYPVSDTIGNYSPVDPRTKSFHSRPSGSVGILRIYGGFTGVETQLSQRNVAANTTNLSGDIGVLNNPSDNVYHVITHSFSSMTVAYDGFTISGGNADGSNFGQDVGGALYLSSSPNISFNTCQFRNNSASNKGGSIFAYGGLVSIGNSIFENNTSVLGGAIYCNYSLDLTNTKFLHNTAQISGGAIFCDSNDLGNGNSPASTVRQCLFEGNIANVKGGAIYAHSFNGSTWYSNIFRSNNAPMGAYFYTQDLLYLNYYFNTTVENGGGGGQPFYSLNSSPKLRYNILWNDDLNEVVSSGTIYPTITECILRGGINPIQMNDLDLKFNLNPQFVSYPDDLQLKATSPVVNIVKSNFQPAFGSDFDGTLRLKGNTYDYGALEFDPSLCIQNSIIYLDFDATGDNNGGSWVDAFTIIDDAINTSKSCPNLTDVWVANGTYYPSASLSRQYSLEIYNSIKLYGGFTGTETDLSQRMLSSLNQSIFSGDIGVANDTSDNIMTIFTLKSGDINVLLDGFLVQDVAGGEKGAIDSYNGKLTINNSLFNNNSSINGGVCYGSGRTTISNCQFNSNHASAIGGAIFFYGDSLFINNCIFEGNVAGQYGGAIYSQGNIIIDTLTIKYCRASRGSACYIINNSAQINGLHSFNNINTLNSPISESTFYLNRGNISLVNSIFESDSSNIGTIVELLNGSGNFRNVEIKNSTGLYLAPVKFSNYNILIDSSSFQNLKMSTLIYQFNSNVLIQNSIFNSNEGRLIDNFSSMLKFKNVGFFNNGNNFTGLYISSSKELMLDSCQFVGNQYNRLFYLTSNNSVSTINKVIFTNNKCPLIEANSGFNCSITNSVFNDNYFSLPTFVYAMFNVGGVATHTFANNVIYGNTGIASNCSIFNTVGAQIGLLNSIIYNNTDLNMSTVGTSLQAYHSIIQGNAGIGPYVIDTDPHFVNAPAGNFNLQMGSPALNTGSAILAPLLDYDNNPRPLGGFYDMGIYEYALPAQFVFHGAIDNDWHKGGNWDTGFPPPNVYQGNVFVNADANKVDGIGFEIFSPGVLIIGNGVEVKF